MHIILTGPTGLVGTGVLNYILQHSLPSGQISKLTLLSRSPVPLAANNPSVTIIEHKDFTSYPPSLLSQLRGAHGVIWAQGISQNAVGKDEYQQITHDYPVAAAKAFAGLNEGEEEEGKKGFNFVYVSGEGATQKPGMFTPIFGRVKGEAESALLSLPSSPQYSNLRPYAVRPGGVDPYDDPATLAWWAGNRPIDYIKRFGKLVFPVFRAVYSDMVSPTAELGRYLTGLAIGNGDPVKGNDVQGEGRIVPNKAIRRIVREGGVP